MSARGAAAQEGANGFDGRLRLFFHQPVTRIGDHPPGAHHQRRSASRMPWSARMSGRRRWRAPASAGGPVPTKRGCRSRPGQRLQIAGSRRACGRAVHTAPRSGDALPRENAPDRPRTRSRTGRDRCVPGRATSRSMSGPPKRKCHSNGFLRISSQGPMPGTGASIITSRVVRPGGPRQMQTRPCCRCHGRRRRRARCAARSSHRRCLPPGSSS